MQVIGHRFFKEYFPENSQQALTAALQRSPESFETDIRLTKDRVAVLAHDPQLNVKSQTVVIQQHNFADIQALCALNNSPPLLELKSCLQQIARCATVEKTKLYLEIKEAAAFAVIKPLIDQYADTIDLVVSSFFHQVLVEAKAHNSEQRTMALFNCDPIDALALVAQCGAEEAGIGWDCVNKRLVTTLQQAGIAVYSYTVNTAEDVSKAKKMGLNGIFSDQIQTV